MFPKDAPSFEYQQDHSDESSKKARCTGENSYTNLGSVLPDNIQSKFNLLQL